MNDQVVSLQNLELIRKVLERVSTHLQAVDLAKSEGEMQRVTYRPLTIAVSECSNRVEGLIGDYLLVKHMADSGESPGSEDDQSEAEESTDEESQVEHEAQSTSSPDQLQLFDPETYEQPQAVKAARKKYGMLADE